MSRAGALLGLAVLVAAPVRAVTTPLAGDSFFPLAVWCQDPANAARYRDVGINLYVALWQGPTEAQLAALKAAGMPVVCEQNAVGLKHRNDPVIAGWMHGDEPDNAQELPKARGYGPPVPPERIVRDYRRIKRADPGRPVLLNLGQGVAWDGWYGRGVRTNHPEDYAAYVKGCDIASFDIYPVVHDAPEVKGRLEFVYRGVQRLREWARDRVPVWACIETTPIGNPDAKPTPAQIRSEVWLALIGGAKGIVYFAHQFKPTFIEAGLLADPAVAEGVKEVNAEVTSLAAILKGPELAAVKAIPANPRIPVRYACRGDGRTLYAFVAVAGPDGGQFILTVGGAPRPMHATVLGENRTIPFAMNQALDELPGYGVRLYRIDDD